MHGRLVALALFMGPGFLITAANDAWVALFGKPPMGLPITEWLVGESFGNALRAMRHVYRCGVEVRYVTADGSPLWFIPYVAPDGRRGVVSHYQPIHAPLAALAPALRETA